jgi:hypothetical protein
MTRTYRSWRPILRAAEAIVRSYPYLITLRQLHYRLVSDPSLGYHNTDKDYDTLSGRTAELRRQDAFPALRDDTRRIERAPFWASPEEALTALAEQYRRDATEGQPNQVWLGGEKSTLLAQLEDWFDPFGLPIVLLRGYTSQTFVDEVVDAVMADGRPAILVYAGDLDPSGEDILRDFTERTDIWGKVDQVAVTEPQINDLGLPVNPGKATDTRGPAFVARHPNLGLVQIEVEAIPPQVLRQLYDEALARWRDRSIYDLVVEDEAAERRQLEELAEHWSEP